MKKASWKIFPKVSMMKTKLLIVADDLTGTLDTGVQFVKQGVTVSVVIDPESLSGTIMTDCEVLAVNSNSRHLSHGQAYDAVYRIVSLGKQAGIPYVYKKTDSVLRGNIGAELSAALQASGEHCLSFVPSYPAMNRITKNGIHYIDGVPVSESILGHDPYNPVTESDVVKLIRQQTDVHVQRMGEHIDGGIVIVDGASDEELHSAGVQLKQAGMLNVSAGCAGFAKYLPELLELKTADIPEVPDPGDRLLVISGSLNPVTKLLLDEAEASGFRRIHLSLEQKTDAQHAQLPELSEPWVILDSMDRNESISVNTEENKEFIRSTISDNIGILVSGMLEKYDGTFMIIGGDTLLACLKQLACTSMKMITEVFPGVVLSQITVNGTAHLLISKSGGFGTETLLKDLKQWMEEKHHERN